MLHWLDAPFWPDSSEAGKALVDAAIALLHQWRVSSIVVDGSLPAPGVFGIPEQWPHIDSLLRGAGFTEDGRTETVLLASVANLPRPQMPTNLTLARTLGINGTRFTAQHGEAEIGAIEVDTGVVDPMRLASQPSWADIGNLWIAEGHRREGVGAWLLGQAAEWLELGGVSRFLAYASPEEAELLAFLEASGFTRLTTTHRGWRFDI